MWYDDYLLSSLRYQKCFNSSEQQHYTQYRKQELQISEWVSAHGGANPMIPMVPTPYVIPIQCTLEGILCSEYKYICRCVQLKVEQLLRCPS